MLQLFANFGWSVAAGIGTFERGGSRSCPLSMPLIRDALLANDVLVTSWSTYHSHQLTDRRLLQSTMESLKSRARGESVIPLGLNSSNCFLLSLEMSDVLCSFSAKYVRTIFFDVTFRP